MSLKVFDLYCDQGHVFEGWFGSANNYESQQEQGLISCPVCASHVIGKKLSAPRLNVSHLRNPSVSLDPNKPQEPDRGATVPASSVESASLERLQAAVYRHIRELVSKTENVGPQFSQVARSMHEGDTPARPIRGTATQEERQELAEEGIAVMPIPEFLDDDRLQ